ncbi:MAG: Rrf2 family transcriptional regulator [Pseudomonadota bacterium]
MKITMSSEMAIHAVWYMSMHREDGPIQAPEVAEKLCVSSSYMVKILKKLAQEGILISKRGKNGGFRMGRAPAEITIADILVAIERDAIEYFCLHDSRRCPGPDTCPIHDTIVRASQAALEVLRGTTVADLVAQGWRAPAPECLGVIRAEG